MKSTLYSLSIVLLPLFISCQAGKTDKSNKTDGATVDLYIGTYTNNTGSEGIYHYAFNTETGETTLVRTAQTANPSFLAKAPDGRLLAVNELGEGQATLSLFDLSADGITLLDSLNTQGDHPCHIILSQDGTLAIVSNYSGGSLSVFGLDGDKLTFRQQIRYEGASGADPARQNAPHIHSAFFDPHGLLYVSDLGGDRIHVYETTQQAGQASETLRQKGIIDAPIGGGPRHLTFSEDGKSLYSLQELTGHLAVYQQEAGNWTLKQSLPIYTEGFTGKHGAADVKRSQDGRFVYATNRVDANNIVLYTVHPDGLLDWTAEYSVQGKGPRNFNFSPDGRFLLVANQLSNEIVLFERDTESGKLTDTGKRMSVPAPVCVLF